MRNSFFDASLGRIPLICTFAVMLVLSSFFSIQGQTTTFAQFVEQGGAQDFVFTNNTGSATFNTVSGGAAISFVYQNIGNLPPVLQGAQSAHLNITATTTQSAASSAGNLTQPLNQTVTISIIRDTPTPAGIGVGSRTNLLTAVITTASSTPDIVGSANGNSATVSATTAPQNVVFSSDFIGFAASTQRNLGLSFSSVTPALNLGAGGFLQSFTAAGAGTFASSPAPVFSPPTAAAVVLGGRVLSESGNGLSGAKVSLTEADGTIHETTTGSFGRYEFAGIESGQAVTITVTSKRYRFTPRIVSLEDNVADLDFYPDL